MRMIRLLFEDRLRTIRSTKPLLAPWAWKSRSSIPTAAAVAALRTRCDLCVLKWLRTLLNMVVQPLVTYYPGLVGSTLRGWLTPRFRTIQVCRNDLRAFRP